MRPNIGSASFALFGLAALAEEGRTLLRFLEREFEEFLKCGRLAYVFLLLRCMDCRAEKLERICRYVSRPVVANERLSLTVQGRVRCTLSTALTVIRPLRSVAEPR